MAVEKEAADVWAVARAAASIRTTASEVVAEIGVVVRVQSEEFVIELGILEL